MTSDSSLRTLDSYLWRDVLQDDRLCYLRFDLYRQKWK